VLLALHVQDGTTYHTGGSGVVVAPGVALTAKHYVQDWIPRTTPDGGCVMFGTALIPDGLQVWIVTQVTMVEGTDLAILGLRYSSALPPGNLFHTATITTRIPQIGELVLCAGFIPHEGVVQGTPKSATIGGDVMIAAGEVTARYPRQKGRDVCKLPFPVVEVKCTIKGAMSGGPVFDSEGYLIGINTSSFESEDDLGPSYISLAYPSLGHRTKVLWPAGLYPKPIALIEMDSTLCRIEGRSALDFEITDQDVSLALNMSVRDRDPRPVIDTV
jgi:hypothetical protein